MLHCSYCANISRLFIWLMQGMQNARLYYQWPILRPQPKGDQSCKQRQLSSFRYKKPLLYLFPLPKSKTLHDGSCWLSSLRPNISSLLIQKILKPPTHLGCLALWNQPSSGALPIILKSECPLVLTSLKNKNTTLYLCPCTLPSCIDQSQPVSPIGYEEMRVSTFWVWSLKDIVALLSHLLWRKPAVML